MNHRPRLTNGQPLGPYKVLAHLGSGGMGEVYLALDGRLNRKVALKLLPSSFAEAEERLRRFEQEASAVSAINHPNILTIYEVGEVDLVRFIATEFIDGETLRKIVAGGPMSLSRATGIGVQISAALTAAHDAGVVHRDIKPENIMIRRDGYVKVLDFGIAKLNERNEQTDLDAATKVKTTVGMRLGTVSYMSPEQARGHEVDARADIWSLGVILYEMISGRMPFDGVTINHVLVAIQDHEPAPLPQAADEFANEFERIVFKALAKDRHARYQTAREVFDDLKKLEQEIEFKSKLTHSAMVQLSTGPALSRTPAAQEGSLSSLPVRLTPLIGRAADVNAIIKQLGSESVRLMTLTGPGGTGKTRLALQVATELLGKFRDGVIFVELAAVVDPNQVALAIAQTVGLKESGKSPNESLKEFLRDRELLLVIDNFEQVEASAPLIAELLNSAPRLKALVTSRAALRISGEHEFKVSPLPVPAGHQTFSVEAVARFPAIELFIQRAKAVKPGFALTSENAEAIVQICSTLDGLPLAIELAAARIKVLPPPALLSRLEDRLKLLVGGARDLPLRQQTMRGAIAWSYDLLDETEQKLFRRLSVFVGGCDLEAIEAVCNSGDLDSGILDVLSSLVDKSLLEQSEAHAEPRFRMLETIADFGREQLITIKEAEDLHRTHAAFFVKLAEKCETALLGTQQEAC
ncbi:MAG TPA: protein kinase, partial [Blastocatellia bacterium]|nr:protein kinase [Blastocatellia bacterium]